MNSNDNWTSNVEEKLELVYPDRWSFTDYTESLETHDEGLYHYYIHFPEIEITNSKRMKHTIYDLYVRLRFHSDGSLVDVDGTRSTLNQAEYESGYAHSHLSSSVVSNAAWGGFCMGGSEPIGNDIGALQMGYDPTIFEALLYQLEIFLGWESLEGGPYKKIQNIKRKAKMIIVSDVIINDTYNRFIMKYDFVPFQIQQTPPKVLIDHKNFEFMAMLTPLLDPKYLVHYNDQTGEFFVEGSSKPYDTKPMFFRFKGQEIFQNITNEEGEERKPTFPHPDISHGVSERLERKLTLYALSKGEGSEGEPDGDIIGGVMVQNL